MSKGKENNKKWLYLGIALIFITIASCFLVSAVFKNDNNNFLLTSISKNADTTAKSYYVKYEAASNKTLRNLYDLSKIESKDEKGNTVHGILVTVFKEGKEVKERLTRNEANIFKGSLDNKTFNRFLYCIELGNMATKGINAVNLESTYYENLKSKIDAVSVYGFPSVRRKNSKGVEYNEEVQYMATQTIFWELQQKWRTKFVGEPTGEGKKLYDATIAKNVNLRAVYDEILLDIHNYYTHPDFSYTNKAKAEENAVQMTWNGKQYVATLEDKFGVLSGMSVVCNEHYMTCKKSGNTLTITAGTPFVSPKGISFKRAGSKTEDLYILDNGGNGGQRIIAGNAGLPDRVVYASVVANTGSIQIQKISEDNNVSGVNFTVEGNNIKPTTVTTNSKGIATLNNVTFGEYKIKEINPNPDIYEDSTPEPVTIKVDKNAINAGITIDNVLKNNSSVYIKKIDSETKALIPGVTLKLKHGETVIETFTTSDKKYKVKATLTPNEKYKVCEPANSSTELGYVNNEEYCIDFTLSSKTETKTITMKNNPTKITIYKKDDNDKNIPGATLQLLDKNGKVVDEWNTKDADSNPRIITRLVEGNTYTIKELDAPNGYVKSNDETFVFNNGDIKTIKNSKIQFVVNKKDNSNNLIEGAQIVIYDEDGNVVDSWKSEKGKTHSLSDDKLKLIEIGKKYKVVEESAPTGYKKDEEKIVTVKGAKTEVNLTDTPIELVISKTDFTTGKEIPGAHLQIIDSTGKIIVEWDTQEVNPMKIKGILLNGGETYTLKETTAPYGYAIAEKVQFTAGKVDKIEMKNKLTELKVYKLDESTKEPVVGAVLQVFDSEGKEVEGATCKTTKEVCIIKGLPTDTDFVIKEVKTPANYKTAKETPFKLSSEESVHEITIYDTPIVDVPNTADNTSIITIIIGSILMIGGIGAVILIRKGVREN